MQKIDMKNTLSMKQGSLSSVTSTVSMQMKAAHTAQVKLTQQSSCDGACRLVVINCRASAASPDIPAIYQNTFSNQLPSECRASEVRSDIPSIYFYFFCKCCPKAKAENTVQIVRLLLRNSCIVTLSPDKLRRLLLRSQPEMKKRRRK